jgi:hypothetical protein
MRDPVRYWLAFMSSEERAALRGVALPASGKKCRAPYSKGWRAEVSVGTFGWREAWDRIADHVPQMLRISLASILASGFPQPETQESHFRPVAHRKLL